MLPTAAAGPRPTLPTPGRIFGREGLIQGVLAHIDSRQQHRKRAIVIFTPPAGIPGGTGKTAAALAVAGELRATGARLLLKLVRAGTPLSSLAAMREILSQVYDDAAVLTRLTRDDTSTRRAYQALFLLNGPLHGGVLILDDACDERQVTDLLPASHECVVLVTARFPMTLDVSIGALSRQVEVLPIATTAGWLQCALQDARGGREPTDEEQEALTGLATLCGGIALALLLIERHLRRTAQTVCLRGLLATYQRDRSRYASALDASLATSFSLLDLDIQRECLIRCSAFGVPFTRDAFECVFDGVQAAVEGDERWPRRCIRVLPAQPSGDGFRFLTKRQCKTCGHAGPRGASTCGVCPVCAESCHKGHELADWLVPDVQHNVLCDCGSACQCSAPHRGPFTRQLSGETLDALVASGFLLYDSRALEYSLHDVLLGFLHDRCPSNRHASRTERARLYYIAQQTLSQALYRHGELDVRRAVETFRRTSRGLAWAAASTSPWTLAAFVYGMSTLYAQMTPASERQRTLQHIRRVLTEHGCDLRGGGLIVRLLREEGDVAISMGRYDSAMAILTRAVELSKHCYGDLHLNTAVMMDRLATALEHQGRYAAAEALMRSARVALNQVPQVVLAHAVDDGNNYGRILQHMGWYEAAEACYRRALASRESLLGSNHPDVATRLHNLGASLKAQRKFEEAEQCIRRAIAIYTVSFGPRSAELASPISSLAGISAGRGDYAEAERHYREALAISLNADGPDCPAAAIAFNNLGDFLRERGRVDEAEECHHRAKAIYAGVDDQQGTALTLAHLGRVYFDRGLRDATRGALSPAALAKFEEAESCHRLGLEILARSLDMEHEKVAAMFEGLSVALLCQRKVEEAKIALRKALAIRRRLFPPDHPKIAENSTTLAEIENLEGQPRSNANALVAVVCVLAVLSIIAWRLLRRAS